MRLTQLILLLSSLIWFNACYSPHPTASVHNRCDSLTTVIQDLRQRLDEASNLQEYSQVVLPSTELRNITSTNNGEDYHLKIWLPRGYQDTRDSYPVLYVTDAETNFGGTTYIVQRLIKDQLIPPMIVVGIAYGTDYKTFYELRSRDLTPVEDPDLAMGGKVDPTGGAPQFSRFIQEALFSFINENYRTLPNDRTYYGHSYGGLFGSYLLTHRAEIFNRYLILSPSLWYNDRWMLDQLNDGLTFRQETRVYFGSGSEEGSIDDLQEVFVTKIRDQNPTNLLIKDEILANETHRTIFGPAFTNGMRYLFE